jgi:hypothetical protein
MSEIVPEIERLEQYLSRLIDEAAWAEYTQAMRDIQAMWGRLRPAFEEKYFADMRRLISN